MDRLLAFLLSRYWIVAVKEIEKKNLVTKALETCYKNKLVRDNWKYFTDGIIDWLKDALEEAKQAQVWTYTVPEKKG